ncbi:MAG: QueG-associated DUF1730 domain-containing protein [Clostridia bacterium]|nr:QueG-associated DUF1730 domain-containing protein [Clostridia bacterium]
MELLTFAREVLQKEKIEYVSALPLSECSIVRPYLLERAGIDENGSVIMLAVPYLVRDEEESNISLYAVPRDYHLYFAQLFERVIPILKDKFPQNKFVGFSDHSPINELNAAAKSGLGVIGKNHMLITSKYASFVFLGEIVTDIPYSEKIAGIEYCTDCGRCERACPVGLDSGRCLSALTQKKGSFNDLEAETLKKHASVWGCDICQNACPYSFSAKESEIEFFREKRLPFITEGTIRNMSDEDFSERAYSWRGRDVILRNLQLVRDRDNEQV